MPFSTPNSITPAPRLRSEQDGDCVDDPEAQAWLAHAKVMQDVANARGGQAEGRNEVDREEVVDSDVEYELDADVFVGLTAPPHVGQFVVVRPANLRWTHDRIQRRFSCGRSTRDVAAKLASGEPPPRAASNDSDPLVHFQ